VGMLQRALFLMVALGFLAEAGAACPRPMPKLFKENMKQAAAKLVQHPLDDESLRFCTEDDGYARAYIATVAMEQGDGMETWAGMNCSAFNRGRSAWRCERFDYRGFRLKLGDDKHETVVSIPADADGQWMRRAVASAFEQLDGKGQVPYCKVGEQREVSREKIRQSFEQWFAPFEVASFPQGFVIARGTTTVQFDADTKSDDPPRLRCAGMTFKLF